MERPVKERLLTKRSLKKEESEVEKIDDVCDATSSLNDNKTMDLNDIKEKDSVISLSDDEDFAGFGVYNGREPQSILKSSKIKEEPVSDTEPGDFGGFDVKLEVKTEVMDEPQQLSSQQVHQATPVPPAKRIMCDITDERYKKPFEFGWKRELVYRSQMPDTRTKSDKAEVYYITPAGKKLRTKNEIQAYLDNGLDVNMFTFTKEPLGASQDDEIVRSAKAYTAHNQRKVPNFLDLGEPDPTLGFGKRIPKPKMPKGVSPPPTNRHLTPSACSSRKSNELQTDIDNKNAKTPKSSKLKGEPCTIQCVLAMGTIPQLQCKKCLCLFHPECVGLLAYKGSINHYICENCIFELKALSNSQPEVPTNSETPNNDLVALATTAASKLPLPSLQSNTNEKLVTNPSKQSTNQPPESTNNRHNDSKESRSVIGSLTTWVPPTANLISNRSHLDISITPPQSIAIVAGRKYIMVPKTNLMSVSPSGEVKIGDNNGIALDYVDGEEERSNALTTGEDSSPPTKKRLLSRSSSKVQTPISSPTHSPGAVAPSASINLGCEQIKSKRNAISSVEPSVHTLFATNFLSNISIGYDVLLHTFQYLKVQELLRASCVCRMWNQVASNSFLWRTVRMKNSQVNDWSGLANTLKRNGTKHLDLRKMLIPGDTEQTWYHFANNIGKVVELKCIDLCRCSSNVVVGLFESNPGLWVLNAVAIKSEHLDMTNVCKLTELRELRLRSLTTLTLTNLKSLEGLTHLTHLSLTSVNLYDTENFGVIGTLINLESLELGECSKLSSSFAVSLKWLQRLEKLRLEKGTEYCCTFDILDVIASLPKLSHLELVNFDIKPDFDIHLKRCRSIKRLLIIPTYISQSATTNNVILSGILHLVDQLEQLTWVVTLELLRVTELYVDQCDVAQRDRRQVEDKIPVLKPVPGLSEEDQQNDSNADVPQVEILSLTKVENILSKHLPKLRYSILKVPFSATWRQYMVEM